MPTACISRGFFVPASGLLEDVKEGLEAGRKVASHQRRVGNDRQYRFVAQHEVDRTALGRVYAS